MGDGEVHEGTCLLEPPLLDSSPSIALNESITVRKAKRRMKESALSHFKTVYR